jgi:hypothetical protein
MSADQLVWRRVCTVDLVQLTSTLPGAVGGCDHHMDLGWIHVAQLVQLQGCVMA